MNRKSKVSNTAKIPSSIKIILDRIKAEAKNQPTKLKSNCKNKPKLKSNKVKHKDVPVKHPTSPLSSPLTKNH